MRVITTLCLVYRNPQILLGMKKRGFGEGRWNGFGGKVKEGESVEDAVSRELKEEAGIKAFSIGKVGVLNFTFENGIDPIECHLFRVADFIGEPVETDEMKPQWFPKDEIPYDLMWPDDRHWMPLFLAEKKFIGNFHFIDTSTLKSVNLELVE